MSNIINAVIEAEIKTYHGIYIVSSEIKTDGHLYLTLSNGNVVDAGNAKGDTGAVGATGAKGDEGDKGDKGDKGDTGDTPVKGVDYWTEEDIADINEYIDEKIVVDSYISPNSENPVQNKVIKAYIDDNAEFAENKVESVSASSTDSQYPSAKAVYQYVQGALPVIDSEMSATSENPVQNKVIYEFIEFLDGEIDNKLDTSFRTTDIDKTFSGGTDAYVPTCGTVKNYVQGELADYEAVSNKSTSISASSTDSQYPSAKAVYDLFNSITDGDEVSY